MRVVSIIPSFGTGGLTGAVLNRSILLSATENDVCIFTYEFAINYRDVVDDLKSQGKLKDDIVVVNPYDYFFEKYNADNADNLADLRPKAYRIESKTLSGNFIRIGYDIEGDKVWRSFTKSGNKREFRLEILDRVGRIVQVDHFDSSGFRRQSDVVSNDIIVSTKMFSINGFCFLRTEFSEKGRIVGVQAFSPTSEKVKVFKSIWDWRRQFFKEFVAAAGDVLILCDGNNVPGQFLRLKSTRHKIVAVIHMNHLDDKGKLKKQYEAYFERLSEFDAVIALTSEQAADLRKFSGGTANIVVIGNPLPVASILDTQRTRDAVIVSRLVGGKGLDEAILAAKLVVESYPGFKLDIFGTGPLESTLKSLISELDLLGNVRLLGQTKTPLQEFASSKISLFTSRSEGLA